MSRTKLPDAQDIVKLAARKEKEFGRQRADLDDIAIEQYLQTDPKLIHSLQGKDVRGKDEPRPVGSGMIGFMVDQDVSVLHGSGKPFAHILPMGGPEAEQHVSNTLEPWLNSAIWLSARGVKIWDKGMVDLQNIGRFWSKVLPAPQFWSGDELEAKTAALNRLINDAASREEIERAKEDIADWKANPINWPIAWLYVSPRATWPNRDERGIAEVVEMRKMSRDSLEEYLGTLPNDLKDKDDIEIIDYANDIYVATVLPSEGGIIGAAKQVVGAGRSAGYLKEPWEHGLGVNPYVLIEGIPLPDNNEGWTWRGGAFHMRSLLPTVDQILSDYATSVHRNAVTPYFVKANLEGRASQGIEEKEILVESGKTVQMYTGPGWEETAGLFPVPLVNPDALRLVEMAQNFASIGGLNRPALTGQAPSGQAGVTLETARQIASGELKIPHASSEDGFAAIAERHLRAVLALSRKYPDSLNEIIVRAEDKEHKSQAISIGPKDVRGYEYLVRGRVDLNIPISEGAAVVNASMAGDPNHPFLSDNSIRQRYFRHENPEEEGRRIFRQQLREDFRILLRGVLSRRAGIAVEQAGAGDMGQMIERAGGMPQAPLEALVTSFGGAPPSALVERMTRGQMNKARTARGQRPSRLESMNIQTPESLVT